MSALKDYYNTGDDSDALYIPDSLPDRKICQTFTTTSAYNATSVKLKVLRIGTIGNITVAIRATSGGLPTGSNLAVCTYDGDTLPTSATWVEFVFDTSTPLSDSTVYAIVMAAPNITTSNGADSSKVIWRYDSGSNGYPGGVVAAANDGLLWVIYNPLDDAMFEVWAVTAGELTVITHACTETIGEKSTGQGSITDGGASAVTQHGHCWATTTDPDTNDSKTENGASPNLGYFTSAIMGLTPGTVYYVRAYAVNTEGTAYGGNVTITTGTAIGRRYIWTEGYDLHYFDEHGVERKVKGTTVTGAAPYWIFYR